MATYTTKTPTSKRISIQVSATKMLSKLKITKSYLADDVGTGFIVSKG